MALNGLLVADVPLRNYLPHVTLPSCQQTKDIERLSEDEC